MVNVHCIFALLSYILLAVFVCIVTKGLAKLHLAATECFNAEIPKSTKVPGNERPQAVVRHYEDATSWDPKKKWDLPGINNLGKCVYSVCSAINIFIHPSGSTFFTNLFRITCANPQELANRKILLDSYLWPAPFVAAALADMAVQVRQSPLTVLGFAEKFLVYSITGAVKHSICEHWEKTMSTVGAPMPPIKPAGEPEGLQESGDFEAALDTLHKGKEKVGSRTNVSGSASNKRKQNPPISPGQLKKTSPAKPPAKLPAGPKPNLAQKGKALS